MAVITGTTGTDTLTGTADADILTPLGTAVAGDREVLRGRDGGDTYDLRRDASAGIYNFLIADRGADGGIDAITNVGALYQSASLGYAGHATAIRVGDSLIIHTPHKPHRFRDPAKPAYDIKIRDQYGDGHVETLQAGGVTYSLALGATGTSAEDIMAGSRFADAFTAGDGNDWLFGNGGRDTLDSGAGDDVVFGGAGRDEIITGAGNDRAFGDNGNDGLWLGAGGDWARGGAGNDTLRGGTGGDWLDGGDGNDVLRGGSDGDILSGDAGDDLLVGGRGGDTYRFAARAGDPGWGRDVIRDQGDRPGYLNTDIIEISGFYGPSDGGYEETFARLAIAANGDDALITADGGASGITVENMLSATPGKWMIETLEFNGAYWTPLVFQILSGAVDVIGDDRDYANGGYGGAANELIFGTAAAEDIYGDAGTNFIWTGAGADRLVYKENDNENWFGYGGGPSRDIVEDFDIALDRLDFTEILSVASLADLTVGQDADGDATIAWNSGDFEVSSILIELRGVAQAEVTADIFLFV